MGPVTIAAQFSASLDESEPAEQDEPLGDSGGVYLRYKKLWGE